MASGPCSQPVGYSLYLGDSDDRRPADVHRQVTALAAFLRRQQYCLERVAARGSFAIDFPALMGDPGLRHAWPALEAAVRGEPDRFLSVAGLAMYGLLHEDAAADCDSVAAPVRLPRVVARLQAVTPVARIRDIKSASFGRLVAVRGTVVRVGNISPHCVSMAFECGTCHAVRQHALPDGRYQVPSRCEQCNGTQLRPLRSFKTTRTVDRQTVRLQELDDDETGDGRVPRTIECELLADLVDACVPGDIVSVCGIVRTVEDAAGRPSKSNKNMHLLHIAANSICSVKAAGRGTGGVHFTKKDYYAITQLHDRPDTLRLLVHSLCPAIFGHDMVKAGLLLALFGGTSRPAGAGHDLPVRADPHVLLMGDPGLGKSQLLQAAAAAAPRGVYVCGNTSSTAGLTVTLTRDRHDYQLEAGALVLADHGCCCIDEFDKMTTQYQPLLEVMEQQSVSIAKGGIVCTLPARASVLAAANPSGGHYRRDRTLQQNMKMGAALLSRFDLVFVLLDRPDGALDSLVSGHIMALHGGGRSSSLNSSMASTDWDPARPLAERLAAPPADATAVPTALLRKYIAYARKYVHPRLSSDACGALQTFFLELRARRHAGDAAPVTTRQLESLVRLTQARARLDLREDATAADADDIIQLVGFSMAAGGRDEDVATPARGRPPPRGKSGRFRMFLEAVRKAATCFGKTVFTEGELRQLATQVNSADTFCEFLQLANEAGVVLKRGPKLYQVQTE